MELMLLASAGRVTKVRRNTDTRLIFNFQFAQQKFNKQTSESFEFTESSPWEITNRGISEYYYFVVEYKCAK